MRATGSARRWSGWRLRHRVSDAIGALDAAGKARRSNPIPTTTDARPGMRSTSRPWWTGSGRTPGAASAGTCSTSAPSNHKNAASRTSTLPSPARSCGPSPPRPTTKSGSSPTTSSSTTRSACRSGTPEPRPSPTPTPENHFRPGNRPVRPSPNLHTSFNSARRVHVKGILGGTEEAGRHVGYLLVTKYLTKSVGQAAGLGEDATDAQRDHARRLHAELQITPCSPRCAIWLLYGIQPHGANTLNVPLCSTSTRIAQRRVSAGRPRVIDG